MTKARSAGARGPSTAKRGNGGGQALGFTEAPPRAKAVIDESAELETLIRQEAEGRGAWDDLGARADQAEALMLKAAQSGAVTWESEQRGELRRVIFLWGAALKRSGRDVSIPDLAAYSELVPELDEAGAELALELAGRGEPIVGLKLEGADLRGLSGIGDVKIFDCGLYDCDLRGAQLERPRLIHTMFAGCRFDGAELRNAVATSCTFGGGCLRVDATNATFNGSRFDETMLAGGSFRECSFGAATLLRLDASRADFFDALFDFATVEQVRFDRAKLGRALFVGGTVRDCGFKETDLSGAIFSSTSVEGSDFSGAQLARASFTKARDIDAATFDPSAADAARFSKHDAERLRAASSLGA